MTTSRYFHDREGVWHCNRHATAGRLVMADVTCEPSLGYLVIGHLKGSCATHISHLIAEKSCGKWSIKNSFTTRRGGRARLNAPDSKSDIVARLSGVRIPPSPPDISEQNCERRALTLFSVSDDGRGVGREPTSCEDCQDERHAAEIRSVEHCKRQP